MATFAYPFKISLFTHNETFALIIKELLLSGT
jgi:hypothetical protein